jgi:hypothetical protein
MASTKRSSGGTRKSTASRARATSASKAASGTRAPKTRSNGRAPAAQAAKKTTTKTTPRATSAAASRNGAKRSPNGKARSGGSTRRSGGPTRASHAAPQPNGTVGTLKEKGAAVLQAADKAGGPALTVAAAVAGLAGGLALRQRNHRIVDSGITGRSRNILRDIDPSAVIEGLGKASAQLGKQSKTIARELDQVAERAERLGKILS